jgi:UrcA family protein
MTMKHHINAKVGFRFLAAAVSAVALLGSTSFAGSPEKVTRSVTVKYDDINPNTTEGAAVLYTRIHFSARQVCATPSGGDTSLAEFAAKKQCIRESESRAIETVHSQALSAYYASKIGRPAAVLASNRSR